MTTIQYELSVPESVTLTIYNTAGQVVETLTWDASEMSSGLYFYRITAGNYSAVKKCLLLK